MSMTDFMMDKVLYKRFTTSETPTIVRLDKSLTNVYLESSAIETEVRKFVPKIGGDIQIRLYFNSTSASAETITIKVYSGNDVLLNVTDSLKANTTDNSFQTVTVNPFSTIRVTVSGSNKVQVTAAHVWTYIEDNTNMYVVDM